MNTVTINRIGKGVPISDAPAGSICEITAAEDAGLIGAICILPFCNNQAVVILNINMASTDRSLGIQRVRPLQKGDSFTVTINYS